MLRPWTACTIVLASALVCASACVVSTEDTEPNPHSNTGGGPTSTSSSGGASTGGGGSGGQGGTVLEGTGTDVCPGNPYDLDYGDSLVLKGTTMAAMDDSASFCGDVTPEADGLDMVYALTLKQDGTFRLELDSDAFDPAIYIRTTCDDEATNQGCYDYGVGHEAIQGHFLAGTYYVFVDTSSMTGGDYTLKATLNEAACGDGTLNPAEEQCDPNPPAPNDGCGDPGDPVYACKFEPAPANKDLCPGEMVSLTTAGLKLLATDGNTTIGYTDDYEGTCTVAMGGRDRIYQVVPDTTGTMTVSIGFEPDGQTLICSEDITLAGCWDAALYVRTTCDNGATELGCSDQGAANPETVTVPVTAGTPYFVFVDGYDDFDKAAGPYNLLFTLTAN